jgi:(R)-citramalate synthase
LRVDRIEVASARVSEGEKEAVANIVAGRPPRAGHKVEVLGFVDGGKSVDWIAEAGGRVINLLAKGSEKHCFNQLRKTLEQHVDDVRGTSPVPASAGWRSTSIWRTGPTAITTARSTSSA